MAGVMAGREWGKDKDMRDMKKQGKSAKPGGRLDIGLRMGKASGTTPE